MTTIPSRPEAPPDDAGNDAVNGMHAAVGAQTMHRFSRHVMPVLCLLYLVAYIDRSNIGFAKLQMAPDLSISEGVFTLGASLFFIGYFVFEVPSNLVLARVGARRWFARIMISWGLVTVALAFTRDAPMFYVLRFALGACEAGFFPGVLYLLTLWVPQAHRARMIGLFMMASVVSNAIGAPVCGALLDLDGLGAIRGWQWLFIATGIPPVVLGCLVLNWLPDGPADAPFLDDTHRVWLAARLAAEGRAEPGNPLTALADPRVGFLALTYIGFPLAAYGLSYWLPTVVRGFGVSYTIDGLINVLPWLCAALALWALPRLAQRFGGRAGTHVPPAMWVVLPALLGAAALAGSTLVGSNVARLALLCVAAAMIFAPQPLYWAIPLSFLRGGRAAAGLAAINAIGNLGGFLGQNAVGWVKVRTGSDLAPMLALACCLTFAALLVLLARPVLGRHSAARS